MSNKFIWKTYEVPRPFRASTHFCSKETKEEIEGDEHHHHHRHHHHQSAVQEVLLRNDHPVDNKEAQTEAKAGEKDGTTTTATSTAITNTDTTKTFFTIRHLKQGATGAVKTWPAAEVLLEYLVQRGGLRSIHDKIGDLTSSNSSFHSNGIADGGGNDNDSDNDYGNCAIDGGILDLRRPPVPSSSSRPHLAEKLSIGIGKNKEDKEEEEEETLISKSELQETPPIEQLKSYNILELGGGTGYLSVGLALALASLEDEKNNKNVHYDNDNNNHNHNHNHSHNHNQHHNTMSDVRLICTDNDKTTIKNMRHNIARQPPEMNITKKVRVELLEWGGSDVIEEKFSKVLKSQFQRTNKKENDKGTRSKKQQCHPRQGQQGDSISSSLSSSEDDFVRLNHTNEQGNEKKEEEAKHNDDNKDDPIRLVSHVIASDVHYGATTLEPLSTIISLIKLRNPAVVVVLLLKERSPKAVAKLKEQIESKVQCGIGDSSTMELPLSTKTGLLDFCVSVRDVLHELPDMKMVEC